AGAARSGGRTVGGSEYGHVSLASPTVWMLICSRRGSIAPPVPSPSGAVCSESIRTTLWSPPQRDTGVGRRRRSNGPSSHAAGPAHEKASNVVSPGAAVGLARGRGPQPELVLPDRDPAPAPDAAGSRAAPLRSGGR